MEYFRYQLLIEDDLVLKPERKYIVGTHPHGVYALGQLPFMFTSRHNPLFQLFPFLANTVHMTGASVIYYIPLVREMFLFCGFVVVSKPTLVHWLPRKHSVGIVKSMLSVGIAIGGYYYGTVALVSRQRTNTSGAQVLQILTPQVL
jgi:hypothetical protein